MTVTVRLAEREDVAAIARLHVVAWHETYRGLIPDHALAEMRIATRERLWLRLFENDPTDRVLLVAERRGEIIGFAAGGPARDARLRADGEVLALYVLKRAQ